MPCQLLKCLVLQDVNTALMKLYAQGQPRTLIDTIGTLSQQCDVEDSIACLKDHERLHALALLYVHQGLYEEAFGLWTQLEKKTLTDDLYPGIHCFIDNLIK